MQKKDAKGKCKITIRPDDIEIVDDPALENGLEGVVQVHTFLGKSYQYEVSTKLGTLLVNGNKVYETGSILHLYLPAHKIVLVQWLRRIKKNMKKIMWFIIMRFSSSICQCLFI